MSLLLSGASGHISNFDQLQIFFLLVTDVLHTSQTNEVKEETTLGRVYRS